MADATSFAQHLYNPQGGGLAAVRALQAGTQMGMAQQEQQRQNQLTDIKMRAMQRAESKSMNVDDIGQQAKAAWMANDQRTFSEKLAQMSAIDPAAAKELNSVLGTLTKQNAVESGTNFFAAVSLPSNDIEGQNFLLDKAAEPLPEGHPFRRWIDQVKMLPEGEERLNAMYAGLDVARNLGMIPGATGGGLKEEETRAKIGKLQAETAKILKDIESAGEKGTLTTDKKIDLEQKLSDKYFARTKNFNAVRGSYENLVSSANKVNDGAADLALITSFMKMLDPGSVVRETEFAAARDTAGLYDSFKNMVSKWKKGDFLQPEQKQKFVALAKDYYNAAQKEETQVRDQITKTIDAYGLDANIVLPERIKETLDETTGQPKAEAKSKVFNTMAEAEAASMNLPKGTRVRVGNEIFEVE